MTFPEHEWGTRYNSWIVDRCTRSCLACRQTRIILNLKVSKFYAYVDSYIRMPPVSIPVVLAAKV